MPPGFRSTMRVLADNPQAMEVAGLWAVTVIRSFLGAVTEATSIVDIQVAAGAALQDLDELQGIAQYGEFLEEQA